MDLAQTAFDHRLIGLGIALALGMLIGLEREWAENKPVGLRSFGLIGLFGGLAALFIADAGPWPLVAGLLVLGILLAVVTRGRTRQGITTVLAALVAYLIGAAAVSGQWLNATVLAGAVMVILRWKEPMHGLVERLGKDDIETVARFVLITLVVLPILPSRAYGPYGVFNPFEAWLLVVLIVAINLAGYIAFRLAGTNTGGWLAGLVGGMISSTATTFSYASMSRRGQNFGPIAALVILTASTVVYARIVLEVSVVAPALVRHIAAPAAVFGALLVALSVVVYFTIRNDNTSEIPAQQNPARIPSALTFGAIYVAVLFAVAAARDWIGNSAVFAVSFASGLTDVDALTLSISKLFAEQKVDASTAWRAIFLGSLSNLLFKTGVAAVVGSAALRRWILATGAPALLVGAGILVLWP